MTPPERVTTVVINFQTPDLTQRAVHSFRQAYPAVPLILLDNGSRDRSTDVLRSFAEHDPHARFIANPANRHHGPAMDQGLRLAETPFVLFLDSDCTVTKKGFIEQMLVLLDQRAEHYAAGKKTWMNDRGFDVPESPSAHPYIRPICMLLRRTTYCGLPPFERHGAPCLRNMQAAVRSGHILMHFPVEDFVVHKGRGTAERYGYRLGLRGKLNHLLNKLGF